MTTKPFMLRYRRNSKERYTEMPFEYTMDLSILLDILKKTNEVELYIKINKVEKEDKGSI